MANLLTSLRLDIRTALWIGLQQQRSGIKLGLCVNKYYHRFPLRSSCRASRKSITIFLTLSPFSGDLNNTDKSEAAASPAAAASPPPGRGGGGLGEVAGVFSFLAAARLCVASEWAGLGVDRCGRRA